MFALKEGKGFLNGMRLVRKKKKVRWSNGRGANDALCTTELDAMPCRGSAELV